MATLFTEADFLRARAAMIAAFERYNAAVRSGDMDAVSAAVGEVFAVLGPELAIYAFGKIFADAAVRLHALAQAGDAKSGELRDECVKFLLSVAWNPDTIRPRT